MELETAAASAEAPYIEFQHVGFSYSNGIKALHDLSFTVKEGESLAVLGANGSGKSTLVRLIDALISPDEGDVFVRGLNTREEKNRFAIRSVIGMVFQNPEDQSVASVVIDDIAFGPENLGLEPAEIRSRAEKALSQVGMISRENDEVAMLSGGQQQLVAIAGALAMEPRVLVLDEATSMLDPQGRAQVNRLISSCHERGMTIVNATHSADEALQADRLIVLSHGELVCEGTPAEVLSDPAMVRAWGIEPSFAADLAGRLRQRGLQVGLTAEEGTLEADLLNLFSDAATGSVDR